MKKNEAVNTIREKLDTDSKEAEMIIDKAIAGGEISDNTSIEDWINKRFLPNLIFIDEKGYSQMLLKVPSPLSTCSVTILPSISIWLSLYPCKILSPTTP